MDGENGNNKEKTGRYIPRFEKERIYISQEDIDNYIKDKNRNIPIDIIESSKEKCLVKEGKKIDKIKFEKGVPVFFIKYKIKKIIKELHLVTLVTFVFLIRKPSEIKFQKN